MAQWCFDPLASYFTGQVRFKLPYPRPNWREERIWNAELITAMELAVKADKIFRKDPETWEPEENKFYIWMLEGLGIENNANTI